MPLKLTESTKFYRQRPFTGPSQTTVEHSDTAPPDCPCSVRERGTKASKTTQLDRLIFQCFLGFSWLALYRVVAEIRV
jgi:hypothetical protein